MRRYMLKGAKSGEVITNYLTFSSPSSFTVSMTGNNKNGTLYYSLDKENWVEWDRSAITSNADNEIYIRGSGNSHFATSTSAFNKFVITGSNVSCDGNIETLLDWQTVANGEHPAMDNYCFYKLFYNCAALVNLPALPATTLTTYCYAYMFQGCTSAVNLPALPATTLTDYCYYYMFQGCTSAVNLPALPATTLTTYCYAYMFQGCTSAVNLPALPATTLTTYCYYYMFNGCTSAVNLPALPATTLTSHCYCYMFGDCTSAVNLPALPATTLTDYCYAYMFVSCKKIKLSTAKTGEYQNEYRIPTSGTGTGTTATEAMSGMFSSTGGTFVGAPTINTTYYTSNVVISA